MSTLSSKSSQIVITIQTKNPTYTPEIFAKGIQELGYMGTPGNAQLSMNPYTPPNPTTLFSKGNMMVITNYAENLIRITIINTLDLNQLSTEINNMLEKLLILPQTINIIDLACKTEIPTSTSPTDTLTHLVYDDALKKISKVLNVTSMQVLSMGLANSNWQDGDFRISIEPLASDPENQYWFVVKYVTKSLLNFNKIVEKFNSQTIENIISSLQRG